MFLGKGVRIFVYDQEIDMRFAFEKLSYLIREKLNHELSEGDVYLFLGKNRKRLKLLFFDGSGLILVCKRMEKNPFMCLSELNKKREITRQELRFIVHGSVLRQYQPDVKVKK